MSEQKSQEGYDHDVDLDLNLDERLVIQDDFESALENDGDIIWA